MGKLSDIHQQATEVVDELGEIPADVYEEAIIDEARRILMERKDESESNDCV